MERALNTYLATGEIVVDGGDDEEMDNYILDCVKYVVDAYENHPGENKTMLVEARLDLHYMTMRDDLWGSGDVVIMSTELIEVIDLKYGSGIFVPADNPQCRIYALGAMCLHMKPSRGEMPWHTIRSTILQPRYPDKDGNWVRMKDFTPDELDSWKDDVLLPAAALTDTAVTPVAGDKQCKWCPCKATCPAAQDRVREVCAVFQPVDSGHTIFDADPVVEDAETMEIEKLLQVHDNIPFIEGYLKAVNARIRALCEARDPRMQGKKKLVRGRSQNKWDADADEIIADLSKGTGKIPKSKLQKLELISAAQALKLKGLKEAQRKKLQSRIKKQAGSMAIVPWSDERENLYPPLPFEAQPDDPDWL